MKLGMQTLPENAGKQDAFHVPSVCVTSYDGLRPCDWVKFIDDTFSKVIPCEKTESHAVVDPWSGPVKAGTCVWVMLNPGLVEELTHKFKINAKVGTVFLPGAINTV